MSLSKLLRALLLALLIAAPLAACGKKGPPTAPDSEQDQYPRTYPTR